MARRLWNKAERVSVTKKREEIAYHEGRVAQEGGKGVQINPYPGGETLSGFNPLRYHWFMGWYDRRHEQLGLC